MREDLLRIFGSIIIGLTILIGTFAAIQFISVSPIWEDATGWVQAIGSIAAIIAAIWISRGDVRRRERDEYALALIAAVNTANDAMVISHDLDHTIRALQRSKEQGYPWSELEYVRQTITEFRIWTVEEIAQLSGLGGNCALNLARSQHALASVKWVLDRHLTIRRDITPTNERRAELAEHVVAALVRARWNIEEALADMVQASDPTHIAGFSDSLTD